MRAKDQSVITPVILLSGFLGSGKTTLLGRIIDTLIAEGKKPVVIMNELGEVSLDSEAVPQDIPIHEMMNGCICCSVRGDLSVSVKQMKEQYTPDLIIVEATGLANPLEIVEAITDVSLLMYVELRVVITVVDAKFLLDQHSTMSKRSLRLMKDQIRGANIVLLNKMDLVEEGEISTVKGYLHEWNPHAPIMEACKADAPVSLLLGMEGSNPLPTFQAAAHLMDGAPTSYEHVTVYTHYLDRPVSKERFNQFITSLPQEIYRAKGIVTFEDTPDVRVLFQYAYREPNLLPIRPQGKVPDVLVLMGEDISRTKLKLIIAQELEGAQPISISRKRKSLHHALALRKGGNNGGNA